MNTFNATAAYSPYDYSNLFKVENGIASRDPVIELVYGFPPEILADFSWADPSLGLAGLAWWPGVHTYPDKLKYEKYEGEILTVDAANKCVYVLHIVAPWTPEEIAASREQVRFIIANKIQTRLDVFARSRKYDNIMSACSYANSSVPKFAAEAAYCQLVRDQSWALLITDAIYEEPEDIDPLLPELTWP